MGQLKHRVPVRLRQNWKLVAVCAVFLAVCAGVFGSGTIRPYVVSTRTASADVVTTDLTGTKDLFDTSVPHDVKLTFSGQAYEDMLAEYFKEGEKKYVEADLIIDGTRIPSVGVRLKGNSTLSGLTWKGQSRMRGGPDGVPPGEGFPAPDGQAPNGQGRNAQGQGAQAPDGQTPNGQAPNGQAADGQAPDGAAARNGRFPGGGGMFTTA
ncbi:MAG: spore coat protein CotH, partial [Thermobispora bispora]|nr:spore coat protein CotH [Thermobispora bispora]